MLFSEKYWYWCVNPRRRSILVCKSSKLMISEYREGEGEVLDLKILKIFAGPNPLEDFCVVKWEISNPQGKPMTNPRGFSCQT